MQRRVARLIGYTFRIHRFNESLGRNAGKFFAVQVEDVGILTIAGAPFIQFLRSYPRDFAQLTIEYACILVTSPRLLVQAAELGRKHGALPLAEAVIRSINKVAVEPLARHASAIVHRTGSALTLVIVRDNHSAFAGRQQLAGLKAERTRYPEGADPCSTPLTRVCMRRIFDQSDALALGQINERIQIG